MASIKSLLAAGAVALALAAPPAQASLTFQNVTFTFDVIDSNTFTLQIENFLAANGDWTGVDSIGALAFKGIGDDFTVTGSTIAPGSATGSGLELNSSGCDGGASGGLCFTFDPRFAVPDNDILFTINVGGALDVATTGIHLKVNFFYNGEQIGDLLSKNIAVGSSSSGGQESSSSGVPEPSTSMLALLGLGLLGASFYTRRRRG